MKNNKILVFCHKYSFDKDDSSLTNDLVDEFINSGDFVTIFACGDVIGKPNSLEFNEKKREIYFKSGSNKKYLKHISLWLKIIKSIFYESRKKTEYDICIVFAPLTVYLPIVLMLFLFNAKKKICIIFDFFPNHQIEINSIPFIFNKPFFYTEKYLLSFFDIVTGMSPMNQKMIESYYKINQKIKVLPLWGFRNIAVLNEKKPTNPENMVNMVFGGQIIKGRSIEFLIDFILRLRTKGCLVTLTFFSSGASFEEMRKKFHDMKDFIFFQNRLKRQDYLNTISHFNVGAIVTDNRVTTPTFPSKVIDYMNASIPCICIIEKQSDIGDVVSNDNFIHINNFDNSDLAIEKAIVFLTNLKHNNITNDMSFACQFTAKNAVNLIKSY